MRQTAAAVILGLASNVENRTQQPMRPTMNKLALILLMSLATAGAYAQDTSGGITTSTDPAKAAAVEKHAQELQAHQSKEANSKASTSHASSKKSTAKTSSTHKSSSHASSTHKSTTHKSSTTKAATAPKS
jgi:cytochrome bd-type quinol oxidase subunit 1